MKICIVIQSEAFRTSAGMRIRYDRFRDNLADMEVSIEAMTCADLAAAKTLEHDVYIFCKTFDTAALLLARRAQAAGKTVGQDVFDDYFSQYSDLRLQRFRQWMRDMAPVTDFVICSTPRMVEVLRPYMPGIRITAIEDPVVGFDPAAVAKLADAKLTLARDTKVLEIVWFGIGDNPYFPVGLTDLAACESQFAQMERLGWRVQLRIVTNRRPFDGGGAEILRRLSVEYEVVEWSEEVERDALLRASVAIIPVNGQSFSRAKSLNRAVTALNAGCQVLSPGYPLYQQLGEFIYRFSDELLADLDSGQGRVSSSSIDALTSKLAELADPGAAASAFVGEARRAWVDCASADGKQVIVCLVHGRTSAIGLHKTVGAMGGLSVATIFNKNAWNFPVRFDRFGREIVMRATPELAAKYNLSVRNPDQVSRVLALDFVRIDTPALGIAPLLVDLPDPTHSILGLAIYEDVMRFAEDCCRAAFPDAEVLFSDTSPFAFRPRKARMGQSKRKLAFVKRDVGGSVRAGASVASHSLRLEPHSHRWPRLNRLGMFRSGSRTQILDRALELLAESSMFDPEWYLERYPDVAANGNDPARHYLEFGWREGRNPSRAFSTRAYLKLYRDVADQGINPLLHYIEYGEIEGRTAPPVAKDPLVR